LDTHDTHLVGHDRALAAGAVVTVEPGERLERSALDSWAVVVLAYKLSCAAEESRCRQPGRTVKRKERAIYPALLDCPEAASRMREV
jgi:hypothetical protein